MSDHYSENWDMPYHRLDRYFLKLSNILRCVEMLVQDPSTLEKYDAHYTDVTLCIEECKDSYSLVERYEKEFETLQELDKNRLLQWGDSLEKRIPKCLKILEKAGDIQYKDKVISFIKIHQEIASKMVLKIKGVA